MRLLKLNKLSQSLAICQGRDKTPETGMILGTLHAPKAFLFVCILGGPGHYFGQLWTSLGSPGCLSGHIFRPQAPPKERKVETVLLKRVLVAFKHEKRRTTTS